MIKQKFDEYMREEQKDLLLHWWVYMEPIPCSLVDIKMLEEIIDKHPRGMFRAAFAAHSKDRPFNKKMILNYIKHYAYFKDCGSLFDVSAHFAKEFIFKKEMDAFLEEVVDSYNQPRVKVPLVRDCVFIEDSNDISSDEASKLTERRVEELFSRCIIKDVNNDSFSVDCDFTIGEGINGAASVFRTSSLNEFRNEIAECISMLPCIEEGVSVLNLGFNKYGRSWTENTSVVDSLVRLGMATHLLYSPFSKDEWEQLPGGKPFVASCENYDKDCVLEGHKPHTYEKVVAEFKTCK